MPFLPPNQQRQSTEGTLCRATLFPTVVILSLLLLLLVGACVACVQELVCYLLESGSFSASVQDNSGRTALHISCARGHVTITRLLLAHGAPPNAKTVDGTRYVRRLYI